MMGVTSKSDQNNVLTAFRLALSQERHNLLERPEIYWQQMYNRLQWMDGENRDGPVSQIVAPEFKKRTAPGSKPWFHNKCKTKDAQALSLVLEGHTSNITSCVFSPDGQILATASGVMDKTVRLWDVVKGKLIDTYPCLEAVNKCSFSPTDWIIATGDPGGNVYILELFNFDFQQSNNELNPDHLKAPVKEQTPEDRTRKNKDAKTVKRNRTTGTAILPEEKKMVPRRMYATNLVVIILGLLFARGAYALIMISPWLWIISIPIFLIAALYIWDGLTTKHYICPHCRRQIFKYAKYREVCPNCKRKVNIKA